MRFFSELTQRNPLQTGQVNPMFHIFADLVKSIVRRTTDCFAPNSQFSPYERH